MTRPAMKLGDGDGLEPAPPLARRTVHGVGVAGLGYVGSLALTFVTYIVLARLISPTDFGRYAAGTVITGIGGLFAESGMLAALINRRDRLDEAASTAFFSLLVSGVLLTLGALALAPLLGIFYTGSKIGVVAAAMSGWLFIRALTIVPDALLQRRFSFLRRVAIDPLGAIAFAAASIPLASAGAGVWALVAGSYASILTQAVSAWWFAHFVPRLRLASVALWRELARFARSVIAAETLRRVALQMDALMLGKFAGAAPLGQYRNGLRLADQPASAFVSVIAYVLYPAFARIADTPERISAACSRAYWVAMTAVIPISFAWLPLGVPAAVIVLGGKWRPAGHAMAGLCGIVLGTTIVSIASELFKSIGRPNALVGLQLLGFCSIVVTVTTSAILWGLLGVAIAMSFSSCLAAAYALVRVSDFMDISARQVASWFLGPSAATAVMIPAMLAYGSLVHPLSQTGAARIGLVIGEVAEGAVLYTLVLLAIDAPRRRELVRLLSAARGGRSQPRR